MKKELPFNPVHFSRPCNWVIPRAIRVFRDKGKGFNALIEAYWPKPGKEKITLLLKENSNGRCRSTLHRGFGERVKKNP